MPSSQSRAQLRAFLPLVDFSAKGLAFRRFCGFGVDARTPDETTICRFRLAAAGADFFAALTMYNLRRALRLGAA